MRRTALALVTAITILGVPPALAGVGSSDDDSDYEGRIENMNGTYFGFDLNASKTKVKEITARVDYACDNDDLVIVLVKARGALNLNDARRFSGQVADRENPNNKVVFNVEGTLREQGKARGTLRGKYEDPFYDTPCRTGEVDWRARRGADVEVR